MDEKQREEQVLRAQELLSQEGPFYLIKALSKDRTISFAYVGDTHELLGLLHIGKLQLNKIALGGFREAEPQMGHPVSGAV